MRKDRIGAADHHGLFDLKYVGRDGMQLGRANRAQEGYEIEIAGELAERQDNARIGGLIILDHEFERTAEHTVGLVDLVHGEVGALHHPAPGFGIGAR